MLLAADVVTREWHGQQGMVTELIGQLNLRHGRTLAMLCGPEVMMLAAIANLRDLGIADHQIWFSMEPQYAVAASDSVATARSGPNMSVGMGRCSVTPNWQI